MDFIEYRAKIVSFYNVFECLEGLPELNTHVPAHLLDFCKGEIVKYCRSLMTNTLTYGEHYFPKKRLSLYDYIESSILLSLYDVNLLADMETLAQQAEAVKNEIISIGKTIRDTTIKPIDCDKFILTDFIRTPDEKVVYPFEYWEDCAEVYMKRYISGQSNQEISNKYSFKSSASTVQRARLELVSGMLIETGFLIEAVLNKQFPPKVLSGSKQPRMIN